MTMEPATLVARPGVVYDPTKTYSEWTGDEDTTHTPSIGWLIYEDGDASDRTPDRVLHSGRTIYATPYWHSAYLAGLNLTGPAIAVANDCHDIASWGQRPQQDNLWKDKYVDYDGSISDDPVNQVPYFRDWEAHLCRMAHDVDQFNEYSVEHRRPDSYKIVPGGTHSAETQIRNQNALQVFRPMIGDALRRIDAWSKIDPQAVLNFGWKEQLPGLKNIIENKVCYACPHPHAIREFAILHDYSAWRTALDHREIIGDPDTGTVRMRVPLIVKDSIPWTPHPTEDLAFFGGDVETGWHRSIEWFNEAVNRYDRIYAALYAATI